MNFMVIRSPSQHNAIIGRPGIRKIRAVPSTAHGMLKFPVEGGTVTLQSSRVIPMECAMISGPSNQTPVVSQTPEVKINVAIHPEYPEQTVAIADMTGVPRSIAEHRLNIREGYSPVRQKKKMACTERNKAIKRCRKIMYAGIMKEVHYHSWLSNPVMVKKHDGTWRIFTYAMILGFEATNNEAEYEALIAGLRIAEQMGVKNLQANVDSRLVANQVNGLYTAKESGMVQYLNKVKTLAKSFEEFSIKQIPRSENKKADALSKIASTSFAHLNKQVLVEELKEKSINEKEILDVVQEEGNTWMTPIREYLTKEILPEDKKKARAYDKSSSGVMQHAFRSQIGVAKHPNRITANNAYESKEISKVSGKDSQDHRPVPKKSAAEYYPHHVLHPPMAIFKSGDRHADLSRKGTQVNQANNNEALGSNIEPDRRKKGASSHTKKQKARKDGKVLQTQESAGRNFKPGEMVYRSNEASHAQDGGKLGPKWEGPYEVKESLGKGAYKLKDRKGNDVPKREHL
ncbi:reverse transcriptase domain-containing protein [Tanacetum coccineum]